jgi:hypothetical protein
MLQYFGMVIILILLGSFIISNNSVLAQTTRYNMFNDLSLCQAVQKYLVYPCSDYVKSTGKLTVEGKRAKGCISNGIMLSGIGLYAHLPPLAIIGILKPLSEATGCGGIVGWSTIAADVYTASAFLRFMGIIT